MPGFLKSVTWRFKKKEKQDIPLPYLPPQRPSILTPASSITSLNNQNPIASPPDILSFFIRFPWELRHRMLVEAFGDQIVHMHLTRESVLHDENPTGPTSTPLVRGSHARPKQWKAEEFNWWSSVCHRSGPFGIRTHYGSTPAEDECLSGWDAYCSTWLGDSDTKCRIGIMGWLLASRQAYKEGIAVLYETNIIHIGSRSLLLNLPRLLLAQRLLAIKSLEIRWTIAACDPNLQQLRSLTTMISKHFTGLRRLHISLEMQTRITKNDDWTFLVSLESSDLLKPIEVMIPYLEQLDHAEVGLPLSLYDKLRIARTGMYVEPGWKIREESERLWQELANGHHNDDCGQGLSGYWICLGQLDQPLLYILSGNH